jgi:ABC-type nitrate/sulfonate/bicarbonate transport system permease component
LGRHEGLNRQNPSNSLGILVLVAIAGIWEGLVRFSIADVQFLPAPSEIVAAAQDEIFGGELVERLIHTVGVAALGWGIASVVGVGLGLLLGLSPTAYRYSMTSFEVTRAIPPITFVPAALLIFGFSFKMELVLVIYGGIWPVLVNTVGGVRSVAPELRDVGTMLRLSTPETIRKIVLPGALPSVVIGLRLGLSLCLVLAVVAEMVGNPAGLGNGLIRARQALQPAHMFVYVITAGLVGVALNAGLRATARALLPGSAAKDIVAS